MLDWVLVGISKLLLLLLHGGMMSQKKGKIERNPKLQLNYRRFTTLPLKERKKTRLASRFLCGKSNKKLSFFYEILSRKYLENSERERE